MYKVTADEMLLSTTLCKADLGYRYVIIITITSLLECQYKTSSFLLSKDTIKINTIKKLILSTIKLTLN